MPTSHAAIQTATARLTAAGVDNPPLDARLLVAHGLGCDRLALLMDPQREISEDEAARITALVGRRAAREPVARILGVREFWGLPFGLNEATLEPRPDSETVIEAALQIMQTPPKRILDLGTGTGCLLLALLHEWPNATGLGVDIAPRAVEQALANAAQLGLDDRAWFQTGDWFAGIGEEFDLVVSNPPYIPDSEIAGLMPEVRLHDPIAALAGGSDGLAPYRVLAAQAGARLRRGGAVIFEVGAGQAGDVMALLNKENFARIAMHRDLGHIERCISAFKD